MSKRRLYFIGVVMGIADLVPGISGGTIAFISGIYERLLSSIKTLRVQNFKKIAWPFLVPLGCGIATSILLFSKLFYFLLLHYQAPLFGFFFGLILASTLLCARQARIKKFYHLLPLLGGALFSFILALLPTHLLFGTGFWGLVLAGMLGAGAMLLPGISGSYILQVIGVYPLVIHALATPTSTESIKLLAALGVGICLGFILFSRVISFLLFHFQQITLLVLVGFLAMGLKDLWPFAASGFIVPFVLAITGFALAIFLETKSKGQKCVQSQDY